MLFHAHALEIRKLKLGITTHGIEVQAEKLRREISSTGGRLSEYFIRHLSQTAFDAHGSRAHEVLQAGMGEACDAIDQDLEKRLGGDLEPDILRHFPGSRLLHRNH